MDLPTFLIYVSFLLPENKEATCSIKYTMKYIDVLKPHYQRNLNDGIIPIHIMYMVKRLPKATVRFTTDDGVWQVKRYQSKTLRYGNLRVWMITKDSGDPHYLSDDNRRIKSDFLYSTSPLLQV